MNPLRPALAALLLTGCGASTGLVEQANATNAAGSEAVIYTGAAVITLDPSHPRAKAIRVDKGRITDVYDSDPAPSVEGKRVDLKGAAILPGLVDAHLHLRSLGAAQREVDLRGTTSVADIVSRLREAAKSLPEGAVIRGRGWDQNDWDKPVFPTHAPLDEALPKRLIWLERVDGHAVWVSGSVLEMAGIRADTRSMAGGEILHDDKGAVTGVFIDNAVGLVEGKLPPASPAELRADLEKGMELCRKVGLTAVHDMGTEPAALRELQALEREGKLTLRVYAYLGGAWPNIEPLLRGPRPSSDTMVRVMGIKLFADGALGSRGAALLSPYSDRPDTSGLLVTEEEELYRRAKIAHDAGYDVTIHAIGDRGNRVALDTLARAEGQDRSHHHRIEHAQVVSKQDIPRFAALGVIASMQPTHATSDMPWAESRVGPERIKGAYAWRTLQKAGATLVFGSDAPVEDENPWYGVYAAVTRTDASGLPKGGFYPEERLDVMEAITAFSRTPNEITGARDLGVIRPGAIADLTIVAADPTAVRPEELRTMRTLHTIVAGREVF